MYTTMFGCAWTTFSVSSGGWVTARALGLGDVSPHTINIQLPLEVPRVSFGPGGLSTAPSLGISVVNLSTLHVPTTIIITRPLTLGPGIAEDAGEDIMIRSLAVWPLVSGRVASSASMSMPLGAFWFGTVFPWAGTVEVPTSGLTSAMGDLGLGGPRGYLRSPHQ